MLIILLYNCLENYIPPQDKAAPEIVLEYLRFTIHKTILWRFENNQTCTPSVSFTIQLSTCDSAHPINTWTTPNFQYSLPLAAFINDRNELLYISVRAVSADGNECARTAMFQINPNGKL